MSSVVFPDFSGSGSGGGGGGGGVTFPLVGPPGSAGAETYGFTSGGGLHGTSGGGVVLSVANGGDSLLVSAQGDISLAHALSVTGLASLPGGVSASTVSASSITTTGNIGIGGSLGVQGSAQLTGDLSARKITASSDLSAASLSTAGAIAGATLSITGAVTLGSLKVAGTFRAEQIQSDGALLFPVSDSSMPGIGLGEEPSTGIFGVQGTLGFSVAGSRVLSFGSDLKASFAGALQATDLVADSLTAHNLTIDTSSTLQSLSVTTLTASGAASLQAGLTVASGLTVTGTTRLDDLRIDLLSTDHNLQVGQDASVVGKLTVQGATALAGLTAGDTTLGNLAAGKVLLQSAYMLAGPDGYTPVRRDPIPGQPGTTDYVVTLDPGGNLAFSGSLFAGKDTTLNGALSVAGGFTGAAATFSGVLTAQSDASVAGKLTAAYASLAGSAFLTGNGTPIGSAVGSVGDIYIDRSAGGLYLKASGQATNQGWVVVSTSASSLTYPLQAPSSTASDGPSFAFSAAGGDGLGYDPSGLLYLSVGNNIALQVDADGTVEVGGTVSAFEVDAANLSGRSLHVISTATFDADLTAASAAIAGQLTAGGIQSQGTLNAGSTTLSALTVNGPGHFTGSVTIDQGLGVTQQVSAASAVLSGATLSAGSGSPAATVTGSPGDLYLDRSAGDLWLKTSGQASSSGWTKVSTAAAGTTFPLTAPDGSLAMPSYGFSQGGLGITASAPQTLAGITNGAIGWTLGPDKTLAAKGALTVAGNATLQALSATSAAISGAATAGSLSGGTLSVSGASTLAGLTAGATTASSLTSQAGISAATTVTIAGSAITPGTAQPASGTGQQGDLAPTTQGSVPLYVRGSSGWRAVALVGDAAPTTFPLRGPADSASSPNYAWSASPSTGLFSPGTNQLGFVTNGTQAGSVDANQAWTLVGPLTAGSATFPSATINGNLSATGNASIGGTLGVTGAVTFSSSLTSGDITSSGKLTGQTATINGALSAQTATTSGDVTIGGSLTVNGTTTYAGVQRTGYIQTGDGTITSPAFAFTSETGLGAWRAAAGTYAIAASGANLVTFASGLAAFSGAIRVSGTNAGIFAPSGNALAIQTGGTTALTVASNQTISIANTITAPTGSASSANYAVGNSTFGFYGYNNSGNVVPAVTCGGVTVATFFRGQAANNYYYYALGLGDIANPNPGAQSGQGLIFGSSTPPNGQVAGTAGSLYCHWAGSGTTPALYVNEVSAGSSSNTTWQRVLTTSSSITPSFPVVGPAGSASSPTYQAASGNGLYSGTDGLNRAFTGLAQGGASVGRFATFTNNSLSVWLFGLGDAASSSISGGLLASAQAPSTGAPNALPGMLYQYLGGGQGQSLWINESTGATPSWAKVLTSTSGASVSFPIAAPLGSASAPSYGFGGQSGYASTGVFAAAEASTGNPVVALSSNGVAVGFLQSQTVNSQTLNSFFFGPPSGSMGGIRASAQSPAGNVAAFAGQVFLNTNAGLGTTLWVKESFNSSTPTAGWASIFTSGQAQIASQQGSISTPYYSFSGATGTGLTYVNDSAFGSGGTSALVQGGRVIAYISAGSANSIPINNIVLGDPATSSAPYPAAIRATAQAANGNLVGAIGQLAINPAGGNGTVLAVKESGTGNTSGWSFVLTETSAPKLFSITQSTAPVSASGITKLYSDTSGNLGVVSSQGAAASQTQYVRIDGQATVLSANLTLTAAMNGATLVASSATPYTVTMPASVGYDLRFYFQVENASGLTIKAATGQVIYVGPQFTTSGGTVTTTSIGSTIELFLRANSTTVYARGPTGTYTTA